MPRGRPNIHEAGRVLVRDARAVLAVARTLGHTVGGVEDVLVGWWWLGRESGRGSRTCVAGISWWIFVGNIHPASAIHCDAT